MKEYDVNDYYINSKGEKMLYSRMNTEHIINGISKCSRDIFNSKNKKEFSEYLDKMNKLKQELHKRLNDFNERLGD